MEPNDYFEAAKLIAGCPANRLPHVLTLLKQSGVDLEKSAVRKAYAQAVKAKGDEGKRKEKRKERGHREWERSDLEAVIRLREAYEAGTSFTELSRLTGINRTTLYRYMYGEITLDEERDTLILDALSVREDPQQKNVTRTNDGFVTLTIRIPQDLYDAYHSLTNFWEDDEDEFIRFMKYRVQEYAPTKLHPQTKRKRQAEPPKEESRPFWEEED